MTVKQQEPVKVAIVGSGLSGLAAGYILSNIKRQGQPAFQVHLFEKAATLGMDSASFQLPLDYSQECTRDPSKKGRRLNAQVDVPMRSFFPEYYPYVTQLYDHIHIPYTQSDNSMSFTAYPAIPSQHQEFLQQIPQGFPSTFSTSKPTAKSPPPSLSESEPYFSFSCYHIGKTLFSLPDPPSSPYPFTWLLYILVLFQVVFDYLRLLVLSKCLFYGGFLKHGSTLRTWTLADFMAKFYFSQAFVRGCFFPLFSGACTCSFDTLEKMPCVLVLEYVAKCMPFGKLCFVTSSIQHVVTQLSAPIHAVHTSTTIQRITQKQGGYVVHTDTTELECDHVIFATQANQAARVLLQSMQHQPTLQVTPTMDALSVFPYDKSLVICHQDETLLPPRSYWRFLNFACDTAAPLSPQFYKSSSTVSKPKSYYGYDPKNISQTTHLVHFTLPDPQDLDSPIEKTLSAKLTFDLPSQSTPQSRYVMQTTNPIVLPDPKKTYSTSWFERCVVTMASFSNVHKVWGQTDATADAFFNTPQEQLVKPTKPDYLDSETCIQGKENLWFVGSYIWPGIPLLEGCVASSVYVIKGLCWKEGIPFELPWMQPTTNKAD